MGTASHFASLEILSYVKPICEMGWLYPFFSKLLAGRGPLRADEEQTHGLTCLSYVVYRNLDKFERIALCQGRRRVSLGLVAGAQRAKVRFQINLRAREQRALIVVKGNKKEE